MSTSRIHQLAQVTGQSGSAIELVLERAGSCGHCVRKSGCGYFQERVSHQFQLNAGNTPELLPGQKLRFSLPAAGISRLAIIRYLTIPVAMLGTAVLASASLNLWTDMVAALGAVAGFLVGCAALKLYDSHAGRYWLDKVEFQYCPETGSGDP